MRTAKIVLNEQEHTITELKIRKNAEWVRHLKDQAREPIDFILDALGDLDLEDPEKRGPLLDQTLALLGDAQDTIADLAILYAPELKDQIEDAYASEVMAAFVEMVKLAVPFDWEPWLEKVREQLSFSDLLSKLSALGEKAQETEPS